MDDQKSDEMPEAPREVNRPRPKIPKKMKWLLILSAAAYLCLFLAGQLYFQQAENMQWLLYYDSSYEVKLVEEVKNKELKPVEGALVVALWPLDLMPGEGYGGYAKIIVAATDKEGTATIPGWLRFSPLSFLTATHWLAPRVVFYKPGYKVITQTGAQMRKKEGFLLKLVRVHTDEERLNNYDELSSWADFPDTHYTKEQARIIFEQLDEELSKITTKSLRISILKKSHNELREYWAGGKK